MSRSGSGGVERTELAPGLTVSRVLSGLWQVADMERGGEALDPERAAEALLPYVEAGLTSFDMADHYGSAEIIAGRLRARLGDASPPEFLTKWVPAPGPVTRDDVRSAVERTLDRLRCDRIDLLQFHTWRYDDPAWLDSLFWLDELRAEGLISHLGLTNVDTPHLQMVLASGIRVASNQVSYSLLDRRAGGAMAQLCRKHGVGLLAYGTLAGGFLSERWVDAPDPGSGQLGSWSRMKYRRFIEATGGWSAFQELLRGLRGVAQRKDVPMAAVASRLVLDQPAVAGVIVGLRPGGKDRLEDTLRILDIRLDEEDHADLAAAAGSLRPIPGDCGDEYRRPPFLTASGDLSHHLDSVPLPYPPLAGGDGRTLVMSGTPWEDRAGYARAVQSGDRVWVSGTTATHGSRLIGGDDAEAQTHFVIDKVEGTLRSLGARLEDVVRTRLFVAHRSDWESVARAHGRRFGEIRPANTLVLAGLIGDGYRVEMEAEAVVTPEEG